MHDPLTDNCQPIPAPNRMALREAIMDEE